MSMGQSGSCKSVRARGGGAAETGGGRCCAPVGVPFAQVEPVGSAVAAWMLLFLLNRHNGAEVELADADVVVQDGAGHGAGGRVG